MSLNGFCWNREELDGYIILKPKKFFTKSGSAPWNLGFEEFREENIRMDDFMVIPKELLGYET